jgi:HTH-type transcriptional regulator/antitoxin HipB
MSYFPDREEMARVPLEINKATKVTSPKDLGALVRAVRREAGLAQATAAGLAGVGTRFLGDVERGKPTLRLGLVLQVLERLGLELTIARRRGGRRS